MSIEYILKKLNWERKLNYSEQEKVRQALREYHEHNARWKSFTCLWECSNCRFWIDKCVSGKEGAGAYYRPDDFIKHFSYCPGCGARMENTYKGRNDYEE